MNTRENFWNVHCFATNQMEDETAKDNRQTATSSSHDLTETQRAGCFFLDKSSCLPLSNAERVLFLFQLIYQQIVDMNDILQKSDVESTI